MFGKGKKKTTNPEPSNEEVLAPEKRSQAAVSTSNSNAALVLISFLMIGVFVAGALLLSGKKEAEAPALESAEPEVAPVPITKSEFDDVAPSVASNPANASIRDARIGESASSSILVSVSGAPIKVISVSASSDTDGFFIDEDCTSQESITPAGGCSVDVKWTPASPENKSLFIIIRYTPAISAEPDDKTFRIPLELASVGGGAVAVEAPAPAPVAAPVPSFEPEIEEEEEEFEEEEYEEEDEEPAAKVTPRGAADAKKIVFPADCKRFASKAYDFSGVFIGWAHGNKDVFSPNCSKLIGSLSEDGMVIAVGTGKIIGKGVVMDKKKSDERRIELALPALQAVQNNLAADNFNPDLEDVLSNRAMVKDEGFGNPCEDENGECNKVSDPLGIMSKRKNSFVPFTIETTDQVSSSPKDERYVLRQSKPIPAVLVRPIFISTLADDSESPAPDNLTAVATVERNVYGGDGRTVVIPAGSQLIGAAAPQELSGAQALAKIDIDWSRLIRPDGAEFDLTDKVEGTADAQGRSGVPGKNDTKYMRDLFLKPILYSALPVAMEAMFPTTSQFVNRVKRSDGSYQVWSPDDEDFIAMDNIAEDVSFSVNPDEAETMMNMTSRDKMKMEVQQNWKNVANKLMEESLRQRIPFTVPAGTRIQIYLNTDIMLKIDDEMDDLLNNE
ncbi:MAG: TrbI/VirB10 family protein [Rickettsiales bacterium]|jgi:type IV secretory pathway VirB10-like protein|nr:TrbI/VirB10 family protein [Rickettsiales bacterium]